MGSKNVNFSKPTTNYNIRTQFPLSALENSSRNIVVHDDFEISDDGVWQGVLDAGSGMNLG